MKTGNTSKYKRKWQPVEVTYHMFKKDEVHIDGGSFGEWMKKSHPEVGLDQVLDEEKLDLWLDEYEAEYTEK